jgi:hypothetical protein
MESKRTVRKDTRKFFFSASHTARTHLGSFSTARTQLRASSYLRKRKPLDFLVAFISHKINGSMAFDLGDDVCALLRCGGLLLLLLLLFEFLFFLLCVCVCVWNWEFCWEF